MFATVRIGDKDVEMAATAASPIHYRQLFKRDALRIFEKFQAQEMDKSDAIELFNELGFIMAMTAKKADMFTLSQADYISWLEQFDYMDLIDASDAIANVYFNNRVQTSEAKN